jgi:hypothetical protein
LGLQAAPAKFESGIAADQDLSGVDHRLVDCYQDVREYRTNDEVDMVVLDHPAHFLDRDIGLEFIIDNDELDVSPTHFAAEVFQGELETVFRLLAERGGRTRQRINEANADLVLCGRRVNYKYKCRGCRQPTYDSPHDRTPPKTPVFAPPIGPIKLRRVNCRRGAARLPRRPASRIISVVASVRRGL